MSNQSKKLILPVLLFCIGIALFVVIDHFMPKSTTSSLSENTIEEVDFTTASTYTIELSSSVYINSPGVYYLSGTLENGSITVEVNGNVKLVLDNVSITNSTGPAIYIKNSDATVIELVGESYIEDGANYNGYDEEVNGAIFSKDDLYFEGEGSLNVTANYLDGIVSKDNLVFYSGTYYVVSNDDGIRGTDSVTIYDGIFDLEATCDGIKSTKENEDNAGYIMIYDGTFNITTGGGAKNSSMNNNGIWGFWSSTTTNDPSAKGIKAENYIKINSGTFVLNTSDDSIHTNGTLEINGGTFTIDSGDDGMHADSLLTINQGEIDINQSYEGIESQVIEINDGTINIIASDDGMNGAGGSDSSGFGRIGQGMFDSSSDCTLTINGGNIFVNASGDGLDSNGSLQINGGTIYVEGPTDNGNTALDYGTSLEINGGELIAVGSSGMVESVSTASTQNNVTVYFNSTSTDEIMIKDSEGNTIMTYSPSKSYSAMTYSSAALSDNETYTVYANGEEVTTFTITSTVNTAGSSSNHMFGGGGMGGKPGGFGNF